MNRAGSIRQAIQKRAGARYQALVGWLGRSLARISYSHFVEPVWLEENQIETPLANLPAALSGLRILHLSDLHLGDKTPISHVRLAIERGLRQQCDLIALTGDYVHAGYRGVASLVGLLRRLHAPLGVFAVLGNHDYSVRNRLGVRRYPGLARAVAAALGDAGVTVLENTHQILTYNGAPIAIAGVADLWSRESDPQAALAGIAPDCPRILLAHNPKTVDQLAGDRCDLILSGHTHGGQVHSTRWGRPMLTKAMKPLAAGLVQVNGTTLYINKGLGFTVRFRYQVRPEIALLTLRSAEPNIAVEQTTRSDK